MSPSSKWFRIRGSQPRDRGSSPRGDATRAPSRSDLRQRRVFHKDDEDGSSPSAATNRGSSNGRTAAFEASNLGSSPSPRTITYPTPNNPTFASEAQLVEHLRRNQEEPVRIRSEAPIRSRRFIDTYSGWDLRHLRGGRLAAQFALQANRGEFDSRTSYQRPNNQDRTTQLRSSSKSWRVRFSHLVPTTKQSGPDNAIEIVKQIVVSSILAPRTNDQTIRTGQRN